jgi:5-methylcytosine-specific restriction endonuclease McrA
MDDRFFDCSPGARLLFIGLSAMCDKRGMIPVDEAAIATHLPVLSGIPFHESIAELIAAKVAEQHSVDGHAWLKLFGERWNEKILTRNRTNLAYGHRRRVAIRSSSQNDLTKDEWEEIKASFGGRCAYCLQPFLDLCIEHMHPISRGGINSAINVVPACHGCNSSKGAKTSLEFVCRLPKLGVMA